MEFYIRRIEDKIQKLRKEIEVELQALGEALKGEGEIEDYRISTSPIYGEEEYKEEIIGCYKLKGRKQQPCVRVVLSINADPRLFNPNKR